MTFGPDDATQSSEAPLGPAPAPPEVGPDSGTMVSGGPARAAAPPPAPELLLRSSAGRYRIDGELGRGGMGVVYSAFDGDLRRQVALKVLLLDDASAGADLRWRFTEEARATAQLQHPGIVPVYDIGRGDDGRPFFAMKLVEGSTLLRVLEQVRAGDPAARDFTSFRLLEVFVDVCRAVFFAHERGVIHRDLKPANVMIGPYGEVQVMDWGLAKLVGDASETARAVRGAGPDAARGETEYGQVLGTPAFMPPEQARGDVKAMGPRSDIYALGATLYRVLTGRSPFAGATTLEVVERVIAGEFPRPRAVDRSVPRELEAVVLRAMASEPAGRYATAKALADDVQAYLEGRPVSAYPEGLAGRAVKAAKRHRAIAATVGAAIVLGFVGALVALVQIEGQRRVAVQREREARFNLERVHFEKAAAALAAGDARTAEALFARALVLEPRPDTRERMMAARAKGLRLAWRARVAGAEPFAVAVSPDGRRVASAGRDGAIALADAATGREAGLLRGHEGPVRELSFSPDGRSLASASFDGTARIFDLEAGTARAVLRGHAARVWGVAWSPDGRRLATAGADGAVRVHDAATGAEVRALLGHEDEVTCVAFDPAGRRLVSAGWDTTARVWDAASGAEVLKIEDHESWVYGATFSPDGSMIATGGEAVTLFDAATGRRLDALRIHEAGTHDLAFSADGRWLAAASTEAGVHILDVAARKVYLAIRGHAPPSEWPAVAFAPDGRRLASAGLERAVCVFDLAATGAAQEGLVATMPGHPREVWTLHYAPDGRRLVAASADAARIFDVETGRTLHALRHEGRVVAAAPSPDSRLVASAGTDRVARVWDAASGAEVRVLRGHEAPLTAVGWSPDGRWIATAGGTDRTLRIWDAASGREDRRVEHEEQVLTLAADPGGRLVATSSGKGEIRLIEWETGRTAATLRGHEAEVDGIAWSRDGRFLATASRDATARTWDVATGATVHVLEGHGDWVYGAAWSPDGARLATGAEDQTARIWDAASGAQILAIRGHGGNVVGLAFSPDGKSLATAGSDRHVRVWRLAEVERVLAAPPADLLRETERATGLRIEGLDILPTDP